MYTTVDRFNPLNQWAAWTQSQAVSREDSKAQRPASEARVMAS